jgi:hypothetical protein
MLRVVDVEPQRRVLAGVGAGDVEVLAGVAAGPRSRTGAWAASLEKDSQSLKTALMSS